MSELKLECKSCGQTTSSFFIVVGLVIICSECSNKKKSKETPAFQKPRTFTRYICETHNCGTYNVHNMYYRHMMKDCVFRQQETLGIIRPATYGGVNGDIGRNNFLGTNELVRLVTNLANYKKLVMIIFKIQRGKASYSHKKYYNKHLRYLHTDYEVDFHSHDEMFKRMKFNYNLYMKSIIESFGKPTLSREERSKLYYKNLMKNFAVQVVSK